MDGAFQAEWSRYGTLGSKDTRGASLQESNHSTTQPELPTPNLFESVSTLMTKTEKLRSRLEMLHGALVAEPLDMYPSSSLGGSFREFLEHACNEASAAEYILARIERAFGVSL